MARKRLQTQYGRGVEFLIGATHIVVHPADGVLCSNILRTCKKRPSVILLCRLLKEWRHGPLSQGNKGTQPTDKTNRNSKTPTSRFIPRKALPRENVQQARTYSLKHTCRNAVARQCRNNKKLPNFVDETGGGTARIMQYLLCLLKFTVVKSSHADRGS